MPIGRPTIVAIASADPARRLRAAFPHATLCTSWEEVYDALALANRAFLFVDPSALDGCLEQVVRIRQRFTSAVVVAYTGLKPGPLHEAAALTQIGTVQLLVAGHGDSPEELRRLVERLDFGTDVLLRAVEPQLNLLAEPLRRAVREMFQNPHRFRSTLDLAAAAGMSARATFRYLKAAGFVSPRRLVASARVLRACELLRHREHTANEVAARLGYRSADQLTRHLYEFVGCAASDIKRGAGPGDPASVVLASLAIPPKPSQRVSREQVFAD